MTVQFQNTEFQAFFDEFIQTPYWSVMQTTVEDSPWHREANVAVHTQMVLKKFEELHAAKYNHREQLIAYTALLFHDVGKPTAEETVEKKDGSGEVYRRYAGHEQDSAVSFQECYMTMASLQSLLTPYEARAVRWIIEHHLPYGLKDLTKRRGLAIATALTLEEADAKYDLFFDCLRSDAAGRISDDHEQKLENVEIWIGEFKQIELKRLAHDEGQIMYLLVGPSGSGKSTWTKQNYNQEADVVVSYDSYKLHFWMCKNHPYSSMVRPDGVDIKEHYDACWKFANDNESEFNKFANDLLNKAVAHVKKTNGSIFIDVVNASKKKRNKFTELAKQKGMRVVAIEFWHAFDTVYQRQKTRDDKKVPYSSLKQQFYAMNAVWLGAEADEVHLKIGN
jgi:predicted kinase